MAVLGFKELAVTIRVDAIRNDIPVKLPIDIPAVFRSMSRGVWDESSGARVIPAREYIGHLGVCGMHFGAYKVRSHCKLDAAGQGG